MKKQNLYQTRLFTTRMLKIISKILTFLVHPLLLPTFGLLLIFNTSTHFSLLPQPYQYIILGVVFLTTVMIPVGIVPLLLTNELFNPRGTFQIGKLPAFFVALMFNVCYLLLNNLQFVPHTIVVLFFAAAILASLGFIISIRWNISFHMIGLGGFLGTLIAFFMLYLFNIQWIFLIGMLTTGLIASALLLLNRHSPLQIYLSFFLGIFTLMPIVLLMLW